MPNDTLLTLKIKSCPACNSTLLEIFMDGQALLCRDCGLVINSEIKGGNYVRSAEGSHQAASKCSTATAHHYENNFLEWQKILRVSDSTERNVALALYYITKIIRKLQLPLSVLDESINLYKVLISECGFRGKRLKAISAAIVYTACKNLGTPCSLKEIAKASEEKMQKVFHCYTFIVKNQKVPHVQIDISKLLDQTCKKMTMNELPWKIAREIMDTIKEINITRGKNPYGYIAAAIYLASLLAGERRTQREISEAAHVTEATIRTRYKEILQKLFLSVSI